MQLRHFSLETHEIKSILHTCIIHVFLFEQEFFSLYTLIWSDVQWVGVKPQNWIEGFSLDSLLTFIKREISINDPYVILLNREFMLYFSDLLNFNWLELPGRSHYWYYQKGLTSSWYLKSPSVIWCLNLENWDIFIPNFNWFVVSVIVVFLFKKSTWS